METEVFEYEYFEDLRKNAKGYYEAFFKWKGYPKSANTWEPLENIEGLEDRIQMLEDLEERFLTQKRKGKNPTRVLVRQVIDELKEKLGKAGGSEKASPSPEVQKPAKDLIVPKSDETRLIAEHPPEKTQVVDRLVDIPTSVSERKIPTDLATPKEAATPKGRGTPLGNTTPKGKATPKAGQTPKGNVTPARGNLTPGKATPQRSQADPAKNSQSSSQYQPGDSSDHTSNPTAGIPLSPKRRGRPPKSQNQQVNYTPKASPTRLPQTRDVPVKEAGKKTPVQSSILDFTSKSKLGLNSHLSILDKYINPTQPADSSDPKKSSYNSPAFIPSLSEITNSKSGKVSPAPKAQGAKAGKSKPPTPRSKISDVSDITRDLGKASPRPQQANPLKPQTQEVNSKPLNLLETLGIKGNHPSLAKPRTPDRSATFREGDTFAEVKGGLRYKRNRESDEGLQPKPAFLGDQHSGFMGNKRQPGPNNQNIPQQYNQKAYPQQQQNNPGFYKTIEKPTRIIDESATSLKLQAGATDQKGYYFQPFDSQLKDLAMQPCKIPPGVELPESPVYHFPANDGKPLILIDGQWFTLEELWVYDPMTSFKYAKKIFKSVISVVKQYYDVGFAIEAKARLTCKF